jgi:hypothetical protein
MYPITLAIGHVVFEEDGLIGGDEELRLAGALGGRARGEG